MAADEARSQFRMLIDRYRNEGGGRTVTGALPVDVTFPSIGPIAVHGFRADGRSHRRRRSISRSAGSSRCVMTSQHTRQHCSLVVLDRRARSDARRRRPARRSTAIGDDVARRIQPPARSRARARRRRPRRRRLAAVVSSADLKITVDRESARGMFNAGRPGPAHRHDPCAARQRRDADRRDRRAAGRCRSSPKARRCRR